MRFLDGPVSGPWAAATTKSLMLRPWISAARFTTAKASGAMRFEVRGTAGSLWHHAYLHTKHFPNVRHYTGHCQDLTLPRLRLSSGYEPGTLGYGSAPFGVRGARVGVRGRRDFGVRGHPHWPATFGFGGTHIGERDLGYGPARFGLRACPLWVTGLPPLGYGPAPFGLRACPLWVTDFALEFLPSI